MSDTETIKASLINETQIEKDGLLKARLSFDQLSIIEQTDGNATLEVLHAGLSVRFMLTPDQCRHLAGLLIKAADRD